MSTDMYMALPCMLLLDAEVLEDLCLVQMITQSVKQEKSWSQCGRGRAAGLAGGDGAGRGDRTGTGIWTRPPQRPFRSTQFPPPLTGHGPFMATTHQEQVRYPAGRDGGSCGHQTEG